MHLVFDTWPEQIAAPISREVVNVLTVQRTDLLTYGVLLAAFFASNGIEALRTSLNRAYRVVETRSFIFRRVQSLVFVLIATAGFLAISVLLVFAPLLVRLAVSNFEWIRPYLGTITIWRYRHCLAGDRARADRRPHLAAGGQEALRRHRAGHRVHARRLACRLDVFAAYLDRFSSYVTTYAGLASIMIAIVFLYIVSLIFILGGELNASISHYLEARARVTG